uniref:Uncharacterized protein n=1 Tax=viral metagenome TaxID=1070528 RepID=A0A6M3L1H8_9ZZZZ
MPNGKNLINELDYREKIKAMKPRALQEFTALRVYETCIIVERNDRRITVLEKRDRKWTGIGGGIGAIIASAIWAILNFVKG